MNQLSLMTADDHWWPTQENEEVQSAEVQTATKPISSMNNSEARSVAKARGGGGGPPILGNWSIRALKSKRRH